MISHNPLLRSLVASALGTDLDTMRRRALEIMDQRPPDQIISQDYLERWYLHRDKATANAYLHRFQGSDDDRALHDHPWDSESLILFGGYIEHTQAPNGITAIHRGPGDHCLRTATTAHRIEIAGSTPCVSLFITGPKIREWGFHCRNGWVHWSRFVDITDPAKPGPGCEVAGQPDAHLPHPDIARYAA